MTNPSGPPTALDSLLVGGVPTMGGGSFPVTFGRYWFVDGDNGSDGNTGRAMNDAFKTIDQAYTVLSDSNASRTNDDDVVLIRGTSSGYTLSSMLDISINRTHWFGLDGAWRMYGQGAQISYAGTSGATNIAAIQNTGVRNSFHNLKITNSSTITESIYGAVEAGEYAQWSNCSFYLPTNLNTAGASEFANNGDSAQISRCTFGSLVNAIVGAIQRPSMLLTRDIVSGKVCRDGLVEDCLFWLKAGDTGNSMIYGANANDVERQLILKGCGFVNAKTAAALPAQAIAFGSAQTDGQVILDPNCYAANVTKISTTTGVIVTGSAVDSGAGIGTNAT